MKKGDIIDWLNQFNDGDDIPIEDLIFFYAETEDEEVTTNDHTQTPE